jgi:predicted DsbA family dithiol-disulfide isomerase
MKIELWSDFACPFCYIGKTKFENALNRFPHKEEVEIVYKAYQLNPNAPKEMKTDPVTAFAKGHRMTNEKAKERFKMFVEAAEQVGLHYDYENIQMTNSYDAHRIAKWARKFNKEPEVTARFMKAYFEQGKNIADHDTLLELIGEIGLDISEAKNVLNSKQFEDVVDGEIEEGRQVGVRGVPFFVLNRKYGVSGAQAEEYFYEVLEQLWNEEHPEIEIKDFAKGATCDDEGCSI